MPLELVDLVVRTADCLVADIYGLVFSGFVLMRFFIGLIGLGGWTGWLTLVSCIFLICQEITLVSCSFLIR